MEHDLPELNSNQIRKLIYTIRGEKVMLDSDLAMLYQVQTKVLNQAVKRNIKRFPKEFMFRLSLEDIDLVRSQNVTSPEGKLFKGQKGGRRYLPYVFTEQGIAMLSAVLKSDVAIDVSIKIMKAFVEIRNFLVNNQKLFSRLDKVELKQLEYQKNTDEKIEKIFNYIAKNKEISQKVFFDGQIYDAYSLLVSIIQQASENIVLIDNFVDTITLDILSKKQDNVEIDIYTSKKARLNNTEIKKFNLQYGGLSKKIVNNFHDRFIILDHRICYHIGTSIKDAGNKSFAINKIEDNTTIMHILDRLKTEL